VKVLAPKVLGHRIMPQRPRLSSIAIAGERIIEEILAQIEVPL
jgi:hypothetical protein